MRVRNCETNRQVILDDEDYDIVLTTHHLVLKR